MLGLGLEKYLDPLTEISSQASKEYALEKVIENPRYSVFIENVWYNVSNESWSFLYSPSQH